MEIFQSILGKFRVQKNTVLQGEMLANLLNDIENM